MAKIYKVGVFEEEFNDCRWREVGKIHTPVFDLTSLISP